MSLFFGSEKSNPSSPARSRAKSHTLLRLPLEAVRVGGFEFSKRGVRRVRVFRCAGRKGGPPVRAPKIRTLRRRLAHAQKVEPFFAWCCDAKNIEPSVPVSRNHKKSTRVRVFRLEAHEGFEKPHLGSAARGAMHRRVRVLRTWTRRRRRVRVF